ncbi:MAG: saccharopine dehydrogenase C-terminal domain-containing protein [Casimicrobiaceae bacterium]
MKTRLAVLGGGKIGEAVVHLLRGAPEYDVTVVDRDATRLRRVAQHGDVEGVALDCADQGAVTRLLDGQDMVVSACPYFLTPIIAAAARASRAHYFDLTEDVASTRAVESLAAGATTVFMPQCGLAPGYVSIVAHDLTRRFDALRDVQMRVGALPIYPTNALKYNLTWSTDGLINEYCNPCEAIIDGERRETLPLEEIETFSLDGVAYEAFNTSGGIGTLCDTLASRVDNLSYKTVRYPGHRDIMKTLLRDLRLGQRRDLLKDVLETAIPMTLQDVVLVFVTVSGSREGRLVQETYARKTYGQIVDGLHLSAIQLTTAAGVCANIDLMREGTLPQRGFVRQEHVSLEDFLANRFGRYYRERPSPAGSSQP